MLLANKSSKKFHPIYLPRKTLLDENEMSKLHPLSTTLRGGFQGTYEVQEFLGWFFGHQ